MSATGQSTVERPGFLEAFGPVGRRLAGEGPPWLQRLRREHLARFETLGLPSSRLEEWKNTDVSVLGRHRFAPADPAATRPGADALPDIAGLELGGPRLVFVDGRLAPELSDTGGGLPDGAWLGGLAELLRRAPDRLEPWLVRREAGDAGPFAALNTALFEDGAALLLDDGVRLDDPVTLLFVSTGGSVPVATHPRVLVAAGRGAGGALIEAHVALGDGVYWTNAVTDVFVGDGAAVDHVRLQCEGPQGHHLATVASHQTRDSRYRAWAVDLGGRLARHDTTATLDGEGAEAQLFGLYLAGGQQHVDHHTVLDHAKPHGSSREVYKGILDDRARTVFNGRIIVREDAQRTDAKQSNPNLVLSPGALAHTRPQLEIYADDVKCTHGATVGRLDEDAIFYLRARGIPRPRARSLLIEAFAGEVLDTLEPERLRDHLRERVTRRLAGTAGG